MPWRAMHKIVQEETVQPVQTVTQILLPSKKPTMLAQQQHNSFEHGAVVYAHMTWYMCLGGAALTTPCLSATGGASELAHLGSLETIMWAQA